MKIVLKIDNITQNCEKLQNVEKIFKICKKLQNLYKVEK